MWDNGRPKQEWSLEQLNARFTEMWNDLTSAIDREQGTSMSPEALGDRDLRQKLARQAGLIRKVAWEIGEVADEWARRDGESRSR